ncbi:MAG: hypothetical protein QGI05_00575, partial [Candidatus Omnitrophota bacterium]|nr:hypothetical protein [Candidatus Omnitrophota bacterium]
MGLSYEVDALNRLVVKKGRKSKLKKFRQVIRGRFKVDRKNRLYYEVHKSPHKDVPQKIKFSGNYSLDKKGNLTFTLTKSSRKYRSNKLRLRTKLLNVDGKEIVLLAGSRTPRGKRTFYIIKLYGKWDSDKFNRLTFGVDRGGNKKDTLTLFGAWKVNKSNEIVYRVGRDFRQVIFKGNWEIQDRYILRYVIDKKRNSGFHFTSSLGQII